MGLLDIFSTVEKVEELTLRLSAFANRAFTEKTRRVMDRPWEVCWNEDTTPLEERVNNLELQIYQICKALNIEVSYEKPKAASWVAKVKTVPTSKKSKK